MSVASVLHSTLGYVKKGTGKPKRGIRKNFSLSLCVCVSLSAPFLYNGRS